eukprot:jgi/Pico_ML_1/51102/g2189.t1
MAANGGQEDVLLRVEVEVCLKEESTAGKEAVRQAVTRLLETKVCKGAVRDWYQPGNLSWDRSYDKFLDQHVNTIALVKDVLVELDALKYFTNSMTLTTSNITEAVDGAFLDRADIKAYIGNPSERARTRGTQVTT